MRRAATSRKLSVVQAARRDTRGTTAVEFALIVMLLFLVSFGIIDFGLAYWQWVMAEKATQVGVRKAVVSNFVASSLATWPINSGGTSADGTLCMNQATGAIITDCSFSRVTCTLDLAGTTITCSCPGSPCPTASATASNFTAIVSEMKRLDPYIQNNNVQIQYSQNGLGFVGRSGGLPVTVTVTLTGMTFKFFVIDVFTGGPGSFTMPPFKATLIGEDLSSS
jgi:Flp pilus assembly protein TadG